MQIDSLSEINFIDIEEATPFVVRRFTKNGLPIIQLIQNPIGYKKTKKIILKNSSIENNNQSTRKFFLRIDEKIIRCEIKINGSEMEIIQESLHRSRKRS